MRRASRVAPSRAPASTGCHLRLWNAHMNRCAVTYSHVQLISGSNRKTHYYYNVERTLRLVFTRRNCNKPILIMFQRLVFRKYRSSFARIPSTTSQKDGSHAYSLISFQIVRILVSILESNSIIE